MSDEKLHIETIVDMRFGENAYVVSTTADDSGRIGWVVDPGPPQQTTRLLEYLENEKITVEMIVLTHGHADHIAGLDAVHEAHPDARVAMSPADQPMLASAELNLSAMLGMSITCKTTADVDLEEGMTLDLGSFSWKVLDTGGHSPGGVSLYCAEAGVVITGDALFAGSVGRVDFPGCDGRRLIANIREKLLPLPDETVVYSGHGPITTIGNERKSNPFLAD